MSGLGQTCSTCKKRNHFSVKCPRNTSGNKVHSVEEHTLYSSDEEWIKSVRTPNGSQLKCKMIVAGREIVFQTDTGATVNILPARYATDVKPSTRTLQMWNNTTAIPMGTSRLSLRKNRKKYSVEFMVVKEDRTPLIGLKAAEQMGLVKVNNDNLCVYC